MYQAGASGASPASGASAASAQSGTTATETATRHVDYSKHCPPPHHWQEFTWLQFLEPDVRLVRLNFLNNLFRFNLDILVQGEAPF